MTDEPQTDEQAAEQAPREYDAEYAHVGVHPIVVTSGHAHAPGDRVLGSELDTQDDYLIDEGVIVPVVDGPPADLAGDELQERARELDIKGRTKMGADELRAAIAAAEAGGDS